MFNYNKRRSMKIRLLNGKLALSILMLLCTLLTASPIYAQSKIDVKGLVVDDKQEALIGVSVKIKGTSKGVVTDLDGKFILKSVPRDAQLEFSYIGMKTALVSLKGKTYVKLVMQAAATSLDDLVVVGYGSSTKRDLISSVSTVKTDQLVNIPVTNVGQGLAGRSPGLIVKASGGGINAQPNIWPEQMDIWDQAKYANIAHKNDGKAPIYSEEAIQKFRDGSDLESFSNTNWRNVVLNKFSKQQKHNVRLTGGFGKTRYYLSLGNVDQNSMYKSGTNWMKRTTFRSSISSYIESIDLQVNATIDGYRQRNNHPYSSKLNSYGQTFSWLHNLSPALPAVNKHGLPYNLKENPLAETSEDAGFIRDVNNVINGKGELIWGIPRVDGLKLRLSSSYRYYGETKKEWRKDPGQYNWDSKVAVYAEKPSLKHKAASGYSYTNQAFLEFDRQFGKHKVFALGGFEQSYTWGEDYWGKREHYAFEIPQMSVGDANSQTNGGYEYEIGRAAYIGVLKYNYDSRYYLEGNMRYDGSDYFAPGKRWGAFFSGSAGWLVTSEKFMQPLVEKHIFDLLKLRASYGETGLDSSAGRWAYMTSYNLNTQSYVVNGEFVPGFDEGSLPSPDLTWYTTKQTDIGFDFASLNNRLYGSFDYFYYSTKGYLMADRLQVALLRT